MDAELRNMSRCCTDAADLAQMSLSCRFAAQPRQLQRVLVAVGSQRWGA